MADKIILCTQFILFDRWPGVPSPGLGVPPDGFTGASHHNVLLPAYPLGTKIQVYNGTGTNGPVGYSTMMYLKAGTADTSVAVAARSLCVPQDATVTYVVTNDDAAANVTLTAQAAYALSAMTTGYYGWYWVGGVAPTDYVAAMYSASGFATNDSVTAKQEIIGVGLTAGVAGLATLANSTINNGFGLAVADDHS